MMCWAGLLDVRLHLPYGDMAVIAFRFALCLISGVYNVYILCIVCQAGLFDF